MNKRGISVVAVLMIVMALSVLGGVVSMLVATGAVSKTNDLVRERAIALAHAGFEYALKRLDDGVDPNGNVRNLGGGQFTVGYNSSTGIITVTPNVSAMFGASSPTFTIEGPTGGGNMADCLTVGTSSAAMASSYTEIQGVTLQNTCNANVVIASMTVSWNPVTASQMTAVNINGTTRWTGTASSGTPVDITDHTISPCSTQPLSYLRFNADMGYKNYTVVFTMSDGTSKSAFVQFKADNEAACLTVDASSAYVGGTGYVRLLELTVRNSCAAPTVIMISGMTNSWTPLAPARNFMQINFSGGGNEWAGNVTSGTPVSFSPVVEISAGSTLVLDYIHHSGDMRGRNFTEVFTMSDGTTLTIPINLYEVDMAACLTVNTAGCSISGTNLLGQTWQNTCALRILVTNVRTSWSGSGSRRLQRIDVNGATVWTGNATSGTNANITDVEIAGGGSVPVNLYRFNGNMSGFCFSHVMTMFGGTTKSVASYCP